MNESALPELPGGWVWTRLGEIISVHSGEGLTSYQMDQSGIFPVYGGNGITGYHNKFMFEESKLIIGRVGAKCGSVHITLPKCWITDNALIVDFSPIDMKFLFYILGNLNLNRFSVSTAQPVISSRKIYPLMFGLPPFPEQRRIVTKLEELFTKLDAGVFALKKTQAQLKRYRQSVLKAACEGKLVPTEAELAKAEGRAYEPADVLLARILKERREKSRGAKYKEPAAPDASELPELSKGWAWARLDIVCNKIQDGSHFSPKIQYNTKGDGTYLYITAKNIKDNGLDLSDVTYVDSSFHQSIYERCNPEKGDVLLTKDGVKTGIAVINNLEEEFSLLSSVALFKSNKNILNSYYLKHFLNSPIGFKMTTGQMTGTAIKRIILEKIRTSYIPLPPLAEQRRIVTEVERRLSVADGVTRTVEQSLAQAGRLRQSILKKAFGGRLVAQDANDEPAGVLLERIRFQKQLEIKKGRSKR